VVGTRDQTVSINVLSEKFLYVFLEITVIVIKYKMRTKTLVIKTKT